MIFLRFFTFFVSDPKLAGLAVEGELEKQALLAVVDFEDGGHTAVEEAVADVEEVAFAVDGDEGNEALGFVEFLGK